MWTMKVFMKQNWNVRGEEWEVGKYDDPGDDKQICQRTWEGKNLDGEIGKLSKYFMIPPTYHEHWSNQKI